MKKVKIINDPVGGFIRIWDQIFLRIIDHPYFQRLRRIRQLGTTDLVFPGASHSRFQHTLGAFQLMNEAVESLRLKGVDISAEEHKAVSLAILLHDIGHGPYSHSLENEIVSPINHEQLSLVFMNALNQEFNGELSLAMSIYQDEYKRKFFHQLISGQLDTDRLDYLRRDSFYTGVREGQTGSERLISMMNVCNDKLVIEEKGIYSIENFLLARRFMYWQVYLHKTVVASEMMLVNILARAKELAGKGNNLFCSPALAFFLYNDVKRSDFEDSKVLNNFAALDDNDILQSIKVWAWDKDKVLSMLSKGLTERKLLKIEIGNKVFEKDRMDNMRMEVSEKYLISDDESNYFVFSDSVQNSLYDSATGKIHVLVKNGTAVKMEDHSAGFNPALLTVPVQKFFLCYPSDIKKQQG